MASQLNISKGNKRHTSKPTEHISGVRLSGKFDIFDKNVKAFGDAHRSGNRALVELLKVYQQKLRSNGQLLIPEDYTSMGLFRSKGHDFAHPTSDTYHPMDVLILELAERKPDDEFSESQPVEVAPFTSSSATLGDQSLQVFGIATLPDVWRGDITSTTNGELEMKRIWTLLDQDGNLVELFEGELGMDIEYNPRLKDKVAMRFLGAGSSEDLEFWALRARKLPRGEEEGLMPVDLVGLHPLRYLKRAVPERKVDHAREMLGPYATDLEMALYRSTMFDSDEETVKGKGVGSSKGGRY